MCVGGGKVSVDVCVRTAGACVRSLVHHPLRTQGDVQMAVSMLLVLGEQGKSLVYTEGQVPPNSAKLTAGEVVQFLTMYFGELKHTTPWAPSGLR